MRVRSLVAASAAIAVLALSAVMSMPAFAQDTSAAAQTPTDASATAPSSDNSQPSSGTAPAATPDTALPSAAPPLTVVQTTPQPVAATPVVESIRTKLADFDKASSSGDVSALVAFYNERGEPLWMTDMGLSNEGLAVVDEILRADEWGLSSAAFDLPASGDLPTSPEAAAATEIKLDLAILKYARFARGGRTDPAKLSKLYGMTPTLRDPKTVMVEIAAADAPDIYLRSLHPKHEQFQLLQQALVNARAESEPGAKRANTQKIIVNMERWRWMPEDLGSLYVWLNIPSYIVQVVNDGKTIYTDKIVVGELKYATPVFSAYLKSIVFNPEWTVPPIVVREDLLPNLRGGGGLFSRNTAILDQHELKVKYNGRLVDAGSINWNSVNMGAISFVQAPGPRNVLGKVKFVYPNPYSVYMHDTIRVGLFDKEARSEGHNCPRVGNPGKIAAVVLAADQNTPQADVDKLLATGYNSAVNITHHVPVHTSYFTALVDDQGKVQTFADIYKLDPVVAAAIIGKEPKPEAVADNGDAKPKRQKHSNSVPSGLAPDIATNP
jgi:murein L,D-transpeptidase YcbB/YkuD